MCRRRASAGARGLNVARQRWRRARATPRLHHPRLCALAARGRTAQNSMCGREEPDAGTWRDPCVAAATRRGDGPAGLTSQMGC
eukprot:1767606-Prymnesium_polylepis.1